LFAVYSLPLALRDDFPGPKFTSEKILFGAIDDLRRPRGGPPVMIERSSNDYVAPETAAPAPSGIELATRRLAAALDALENAVEARRDAERHEEELAVQIQSLGTDRSRLANELDGTLVRSKELERTNREIAQRLDVAIDTIRAVIDQGEPT
jgi:hypothetical protein